MAKRVTVTPADREAWIEYEDYDGTFADRIRTGSEDSTSGLTFYPRNRMMDVKTFSHEELATIYRRAQLLAEEKLCRMTASEQGWRKRCEFLEREMAALKEQNDG